MKDRFLRECHGVIHVGANTGRERDVYKKNGLRVLWIEANPDVFKILMKNIENYKNQNAIPGLITDKHSEYDFHIANNHGASSSIFNLNLHKDIWPGVSFEKTIKIKSATLLFVYDFFGIKPLTYDALVLDTQGSELLILKGAEAILKYYRFIKVEVADFESYTGCCQLKDIAEFVKKHGYVEWDRDAFAQHPSGGAYYNIVYKKEHYDS